MVRLHLCPGKRRGNLPDSASLFSTGAGARRTYSKCVSMARRWPWSRTSAFWREARGHLHKYASVVGPSSRQRIKPPELTGLSEPHRGGLLDGLAVRGGRQILALPVAMSKGCAGRPPHSRYRPFSRRTGRVSFKKALSDASTASRRIGPPSASYQSPVQELEGSSPSA